MDDHINSRCSWIEMLLQWKAVDFFLGTRKADSDGIATSEPEDYLDRLTHGIETEHDLIKGRMGWNLTFQGFLFASYGVVLNEQAEKGHDKVAEFIQIIPSVGLVASLAALVGVSAAFNRINGLKRDWRLRKKELAPLGPQPFSGWVGDAVGRLPPLIITILVASAWIRLG